LNLPPAAAAKKAEVFQPGSAVGPGTRLVRRVGFGGGFGVQIAALWAEERGLPLFSDGSKHFKWLKKLTAKG
jgi:hypothetical protein